MEMPVNVKHTQLAMLANSTEADEEQGAREEFHKILKSLPLEMVGNSEKPSFLFLARQVSTSRPPQGGRGTILQDAVEMGKVDFVRDLLEFG